jgi:hypothetical protein
VERTHNPTLCRVLFIFVVYYIILVNEQNIFVGVKRGRKTNRQYIYIVENIKFIYTSFDGFFLPVSQRVEINY